jgi:hypothetical protein
MGSDGTVSRHPLHPGLRAARKNAGEDAGMAGGPARYVSGFRAPAQMVGADPAMD